MFFFNLLNENKQAVLSQGEPRDAASAVKCRYVSNFTLSR